MKYLIIIAILMMGFNAYSSDVDSLLTEEGEEFGKTLDDLAGDQAILRNLRSSPVVGDQGVDLRRELMRRLIIAKADAANEFSSFGELVALNRPGSPLYPAGWTGNGAVPMDEQFLRVKMDDWLTLVPSREDWLHPPVKPVAPDSKRLSNRFWPPIAYGLTAAPVRMRKCVLPAFGEWCKESGFDEVELEGMLWLCERTSYDQEVVRDYIIRVEEGRDGADAARKMPFIARELAMLESGDKFVKNDNHPLVVAWIDAAELFGGPANVASLRTLAQSKIWSAFHGDFLEVATNLESKSSDKSNVVARELAEVEAADQYSANTTRYNIPAYLDHAEKYGVAAQAVVLRRLANVSYWSKFRDRMLQIAEKLEKPSTTPPSSTSSAGTRSE